MGWSAGSEIYDTVIRVLKEVVPDDHQRMKAHMFLIDAFEGQDWDTQNECEGEDEAFDKALRNLHPDWDEDE